MKKEEKFAAIALNICLSQCKFGVFVYQSQIPTLLNVIAEIKKKKKDGYGLTPHI